MKAGFIGLGMMGTPMARNLLKAGRLVCVWNRTVSACEEFAAKGVQVASSPAEVALLSDVVITMLADPPAVESVALGEKGIFASASAGLIWIDMSTVSPDFSLRMWEECLRRQVRFVDAPVLGSVKPAEEGKLIIFAGGDEKTVEEVRPLLSLLGEKIFYVGKNGKGSAMKLVMNLMLGVFLAGASEALYLAEKLEIPPKILEEVAGIAPILSPSLQKKIPRMLAGDAPTTFRLRHMVKDLRLILQSAEKTGILLPLTAQAFQHFLSAEKMGLGEQDYSAVWGYVKTLKR
ncbi:MAG: NAD(P)-dependent oxidoreductase [bacterium JZ-2024 1]